MVTLELHRRRARAVRRDRAGRRTIRRGAAATTSIVTVSGPRQNLVTFRKERVLGIWVNVDSRVFENAPAYLAVLSNRPLDAIANAETLRRLQLGLDNVVLLQRAAVTIADSSRDDPFRLAFLQAAGRSSSSIGEVTNGVTFLTPALYPRLDSAAGGGAGRQLRGRRAAVCRRRPDRAHATRHSRSTRPASSRSSPSAARDHGFALRPRHRHDGAGDRLVCERRVPARLSLSPRPAK